MDRNSEKTLNPKTHLPNDAVVQLVGEVEQLLALACREEKGGGKKWFERLSPSM